MADNKLNYQQARKVRKSSISDLLLDQLAQQESVSKAIGKTISLKSQARIKGIKEKFDPLNIIKFMTFGSRFAPALYGKMMGREQRDIDYFTGRTKSIVGTKNTADKIKKTPGEGDSDGINEQLSKIYSFLKSSREEDVKLKELAKNTEEEIALEKQKRHKELIDTLNKLVKSIGSGSATAEPVKTTSFLDDLWTKLRGLADLVSMMKNTLLEVAKKVGVKGLEALSKAGRFGWQAATAFAASGAATVTAVGAGGALLAVGATNVLSNMTPEMREQLAKGDVGSDTALAAGILNEAKSGDELEKEKKKQAKLKDLLKDAPFMTRVYNVGVRDYLRNEKKLSKQEVDDLLGPSPESEVKAEPVKKNQNAVPEAPEGQVFDAEGNLIAGPRQTVPTVPTPKAPPPAPKSEPVPVAPKSAPVSNLTNNNISMNLPSKTQDNLSSVVNKTVNNTKNVEGKTGLRPIEISVRNDEPTFMGLIIDSTRMV